MNATEKNFLGIAEGPYVHSRSLPLSLQSRCSLSPSRQEFHLAHRDIHFLRGRMRFLPATPFMHMFISSLLLSYEINRLNVNEDIFNCDLHYQLY
jgi:hypothetical protein